MTLDDVTDDATARQWFREQWRRPEFVAERIRDDQWEALAILVAHPEWAKGLPASLFAHDDYPYFITVFQYILREQAPKWQIFEALCARKSVDEDALLCLWYTQDFMFADYKDSKWRLDHCVDRLNRIFAWQYKRTKEQGRERWNYEPKLS